MKAKRILTLLLALMLVFSFVAVLTACGEEDPTTCTEHTDANNDKKCDNCGAEVALNDPTDDPTDDPTTDDPTTDDPTTDDPTTDDPTTDDPTTDDPTTDEPTTDEPTTDDPTTDDPTTDDPTTDDPTTDDPTTDDPTTDDPTTNDPTTDDPTTDDPTTDDPTEDDQPVVLVKDGVAKFTFVVAEGVTSDVIREVESLISVLSGFGLTTKRVTDSANTVSDCEVLVGAVTTRGDEYNLDPHIYGNEGYTVRVIGNKILVLGGSDEATADAISVFKKEFLGITKKTKALDNVSVSSDRVIEEIQDDYDIRELLVGGVNIKDFVLVANMESAVECEVARELQNKFYSTMGAWIPIVYEEGENEHIIKVSLVSPDEANEVGFEVSVKDGDVFLVCGFSNQFLSAALGFFRAEIANKKTEKIEIPNNYVYDEIDVRNVYYADFGAVGDGITDDFFAIKAAHDFANESGNTVHAGSKSGGAKNCTYYLGKGSGSSSIIVKTDTYLHGCKFIFDDSQIKAPPYDENGKPTGEKGDPEYSAYVFSFTRDKKSKSYKSNNPIGTLLPNAENVGWAPGEALLLVLYNSNVKHYIRYGGNANSGESQCEIILIDKDGNVDPTTPVQWTYDPVTSFDAYSVDDRPIVFSGADKEGEYATVETIVNDADAYYTYYKRNLQIMRSNITLERVKHVLVDEDKRDSVAPYSGFVSIYGANNVTVDSFIFQCPKGFKTMGSGGSTVGMGTYEIAAQKSNNVLWKNCTQSNFYKSDGSVYVNGMMGTNYCKNLGFDGMKVCSFDAHCGLYNATIKNSTIEHLNFIGSGTIKYENVTVHADGGYAGLALRSDYGSTWKGNVIIDGLTLKHTSETAKLSLIKVSYTNHNFGYTCYLPEKIEIRNVKTVLYGYSADALGNRTEWVIKENHHPIHLYSALEKYNNVDISDPEADMTLYKNDLKACVCSGGFIDAGGDGICDNKSCKRPEVVDNKININPYMPTKELYISDCPGLTVILPKTAQFKDLRVYVDGEEESWLETGEKIVIPKNE